MTPARAPRWRPWPLCLALSACAPDGPEVDVTTSGLPPDVAALAVTPSLPGHSPFATRSLSVGLDHFLLDLPPGTLGDVRIAITGLDAQGCEVAGGARSVMVAAGQTAHVDLPVPALTDDQRGCAVVVYKLGGGPGTVSSAPAGLDCPPAQTQPCPARFPMGTAVTLSASAEPESLFAGWSASCQGIGTCQVTIGSAPVRVAVGFPLDNVCTPDFCWQHPRPQGNGLQALWSAGENDAWAAGGAGTMLHWNGAFWAAVPSGTSQSLIGLSGSGPADVWAVGEQGAVLRWQGLGWACVAGCAGIADRLAGAWGTGPAGLWAVSDTGQVLRFDGQAWRPAFTAGGPLRAIWGSGVELWAVGDGGLVLRSEDGGWTAVPSGTSAALAAVHGTGPTDVWMAGAAGTVLHWDGHRVTQARGTSGDLAAIQASGPADVWTAGARGAIFRFQGNYDPSRAPILQPLPSGTENDLRALFKTSDTGVWAAGSGGTLLRWNGLFWSSLVDPQPRRFLALAPGAMGKEAAVDDNAGVWLDGSGAWRLAGLRAGPVLGVSAGYSANWAVGPAGTILRYDGNALNWYPVASPVAADLYAIFEPTAGDVWAVGAGGTVLRGPGSSFTQVDLGGIAAGQALYAVWGRASDRVWIAGDGGTLLFYDGSRFSRVESGTSAALRAVWDTLSGDTWIVGDGGTVLRRTRPGASFVPLKSGATAALRAVLGTSSDDVWMAGDAGTLLHHDGTTLSPMLSGTANALLAIDLRDGDVWLAGDGGTILKNYRDF